MIQTFFLIVALALAVLATVNLPQPSRFHFLSAAVAFLILSFLVGAFPALR